MTLERQASQGEKRASRMGLYLPLIGFAVLCVGWSIFWFWAAHRAGAVADGFVAREAERGRQWVCPNRAVGGFPFRIAISCDRPQLLVKTAEGFEHEANLGQITLHARILSPGHFVAVMAPPFRVKRSADEELEIAWQIARASLQAGMQGIGDVSLDMQGLTFALGMGDRRDAVATAKSTLIHLRRMPGEVAGTDLVAKINDFAFSPLDRLTGTPEPLQVELQLSAPGLVADPRKKFFDLVEAWRVAGHGARVVLFRAAKGQSQLELSGPLRLDATHRLEGNLQGRARGLEVLSGGITRRTGLDIGGLLGKLGGKQGFPVALSIDRGRVSFGPFPLLELPPLY